MTYIVFESTWSYRRGSVCFSWLCFETNVWNWNTLLKLMTTWLLCRSFLHMWAIQPIYCLQKLTRADMKDKIWNHSRKVFIQLNWVGHNKYWLNKRMTFRVQSNFIWMDFRLALCECTLSKQHCWFLMQDKVILELSMFMLCLCYFSLHLVIHHVDIYTFTKSDLSLIFIFLFQISITAFSHILLSYFRNNNWDRLITLAHSMG